MKRSLSSSSDEDGQHIRESMFDLQKSHQGGLGTSTSYLQTHTDDPIEQERKKNLIKYKNTYKLEPDVKFPVEKVEKIAEDVLEDYLESYQYEPTTARRLCKVISDKTLQAVKNLEVKRYKMVVVVNIGQLQGQGIKVVSRCLWQETHDNFAEASYEERRLWATVTVYGIYQD